MNYDMLIDHLHNKHGMSYISARGAAYAARTTGRVECGNFYVTYTAPWYVVSNV